MAWLPSVDLSRPYWTGGFLSAILTSPIPDKPSWRSYDASYAGEQAQERSLFPSFQLPYEGCQHAHANARWLAPVAYGLLLPSVGLSARLWGDNFL